VDLEDSECAIREAFDAGRLEHATTATLEAYGAEILRFLWSRLRRHNDAQEAFSIFAEDLWSSLPQFAWRCSMRTWSYTLARNAAARYAAAQHRHVLQHARLRRSDLIPHFTASTLSSALDPSTRISDRFARLREQLDSEDQLLLVLRVDRGMSWRDLAIAMKSNPRADHQTLEREAARLRKSFERIKTQLKHLGEVDGLHEMIREHGFG